MTSGVDWRAAWDAVADFLGEQLAAGRRHLLTEDVVRFELAQVLGRQGVDPGRIAKEHRVPSIGAIDLVIDAEPGVPGRMSAAVEIKFPRDPRERNAADTMTVGELLNDFYRLARIDAPERWALQVIGSRLGRHLAARRDVLWTLVEGENLLLGADVLSRLPPTARGAIVGEVEELAFRVTCTTLCSGDEITLAAYEIGPV